MLKKDAQDQVDPANPWTHFREATLGGGARRRRRRLGRASATQQGAKALAGFGSAKGSNEEAYLFQKLVRTGFGSNNVDHCTRLCHASSVAALMEGLNSGAVYGAVRRRARRRGHHRHRRQPDGQSSGRRDLHQERGEEGRQSSPISHCAVGSICRHLGVDFARLRPSPGCSKCKTF